MRLRPASYERVQLGQGLVQAVWIVSGGRRYLVALTDDRSPPILKPRLSLAERLALILALIVSA